MLEYLETGRGPPVVLLHGNPDCKEGWGDAMALLGDEYHCIAPDLPGFGKHARLPPYRALLPSAQSQALDELLDHLGVLQPVLLVVHDLGALMAAMFASKRPERIRGIIAINTTFSASYPGHLWGYLWSMPIAGPALAALMRKGLKRALRQESPMLAEHHVERMIANLDRSTCRAITRYYQLMYNPLVKLLQRKGATPQSMGIPVRVLWGAEDQYVPLKYARLADEPLHLVEGCSHWLPLERPDLVAEAVRAFSVELDATSLP